VFLQKYTANRLFILARLPFGAGPSLLAVALQCLPAEQKSLLPEIKPLPRMGADADAFEMAGAPDHERDVHGMAGHPGPFEVLVDQRHWIGRAVVPKADLVQARGLRWAFRV